MCIGGNNITYINIADRFHYLINLEAIRNLVSWMYHAYFICIKNTESEDGETGKHEYT